MQQNNRLERPYIMTQHNMINTSEMKNQACYMTWVFLFFFILITADHSHAKQTQPISEMLSMSQFTNLTHQWIHTHFQIQLEIPILVSGFLCFIAASISSAGGIGGGGLFIPILAIVAGFDLKTASSFSAFMVTGGSIACVLCNLIRGKTLIDYDIALLSQPCMLLGVSIGVICNLVFPEWLITILFTVFLAWCTYKTCYSGVLFWNLESEAVNRNGLFGRMENGSVKYENCGKIVDGSDIKEPLLSEKESDKIGVPWLKLGVLVLVWFSFFVLYLLRGNRDGQNIIQIQPCGVGYWVLSSFQIPLAVIFTAWILHRRNQTEKTSTMQEIGKQTGGGQLSKLTFPIMALLAGILGGVFGIGGGMLISPLLLQVGVSPEVTAATCSFMVFFSSSMSAFQYLLLGMDHINLALVFSLGCFVASVLGMIVVQRAIGKYGRASIIVFSVGTVMALSTVLLTSFGALHVWLDYCAGKYMGFKLPC